AVHLDHVELALDVGVDELSTQAESCIVDEEIDVHSIRAERVEQSRGSVTFNEIHWDRSCAYAVLPFNLSRRRFELIKIACNEDQVVTVGSKLLCKLESDSRRAAGNESRFFRHGERK